MPMMTGSSDSSVDVLVKTTADTAGATQTTAALEDMGAKAKAQAEASASSFENFNKTLGSVSGSAVKVGASMSKYVSLPIAAIGFESIKMATTFQQSMEMLHTNAGTAQGDIAGLSDAVLKMAPQVGAGPDQLAQAFYHIASAGNGLWSTSQQLDILRVSAEGAAIGQANLDDTTYSLTSALASNVKGASDASEMMATLNAIVGSGDMHMQDLNAAIGTGFLGTAATFGISIQSVGAALATLTDNGEHADAAATRLRMTWALMTAPSKQASGLLSDLGLSAEEAGTATQSMNSVFAKTGLSTTKLADDLRQPNGMSVALRDLQTHLEGAGLSASETDAILSKTFGGGRTDAALLTMLQNLDRMDEKFKMINANTSQFGSNWEAQQQTASQQFKEAWSGIQASLIRLGDEIMPSAARLMKEFSGDIQDVTKWFGHLTGGEQDFILKTLGVAAVAGPTILILGKLGKGVSEVGDLFIKSSNALGLFKTTGVVSEAEKAASVLGKGAGLSGAVEGLLPELAAGSVALGPVALGIGAVAALGVGAAIAIKTIGNNAHDAAAKTQDLNTKQNDQAKQALTTGGANEMAASNLDNYKKAADDAKQKSEDLKNAQKGLGDAQTDFKNKQQDASDALKKFGASSSQYLDALSAQATAAAKVSDAQGKVNDIQKQVSDTQKTLQSRAADLNGTYAIQSLTSGKVKDVSNELSGAKNAEQQQHEKTDGAAKAYNATMLIMPGQQDKVKSSAKGLTDQNDKLHEKTSKVNDITGTLKGIQHDSITEAQNLSGANDRLAGSYQNIANQAAAALGNSNNFGSHIMSDIKQWGNDIGNFAEQAGKGISSTLHNWGIPGFAGGVQNFSGGMAVVGENGPELVYLPQGSDVVPAGQTASIMGGGGSPSAAGGSRIVNIQQVILSSAPAATEFFQQLDQDNLLASQGLAPNRGIR